MDYVSVQYDSEDESLNVSQLELSYSDSEQESVEESVEEPVLETIEESEGTYSDPEDSEEEQLQQTQGLQQTQFFEQLIDNNQNIDLIEGFKNLLNGEYNMDDIKEMIPKEINIENATKLYNNMDQLKPLMDIQQILFKYKNDNELFKRDLKNNFIGTPIEAIPLEWILFVAKDARDSKSKVSKELFKWLNKQMSNDQIEMIRNPDPGSYISILKERLDLKKI